MRKTKIEKMHDLAMSLARSTPHLDGECRIWDGSYMDGRPRYSGSQLGSLPPFFIQDALVNTGPGSVPQHFRVETSCGKHNCILPEHQVVIDTAAEAAISASERMSESATRRWERFREARAEAERELSERRAAMADETARVLDEINAKRLSVGLTPLSVRNIYLDR